MTSANLTREETAARRAGISVHRIRVELDLRSARNLERTGFSTTSTLEFDASVDETWIDFIGESVESVAVNGVAQEVDWDGARVRVRGLVGVNTVTIAATGAYSRSGEGLHRFVDPVDGETYLYTQYEPADSRRVMACFEQPDLKARYSFVVHAPAGWRVLSNQRAESVSEGSGEQTVSFAETLPLSSYITSVAAGPYHRVDAQWQRGGLQVALGVYCRPSLAKYLDADDIIEVTKQGLDFFDEAYAFPYPWGKYDQIFVPEYNLGAMENPGLVTFTEAYLVRGTATDAQRGARANTILHEMAHMWFGDLVTMRWWDDLWLKESFADYMGSHASAAATRYDDAWTRFAANRKAWAYEQDQLPTTHPIVADITDLEAAKLNFDGITYAKGASVLKQLVAFVGEDHFFEGSRRYFRAHAYGNTTLDDLLVQLENVSGHDVRAWSRAWLETSGVSTLSLEAATPGDSDSVAGAVQGEQVLVQTDPRPHRLRVGFYDLVEGRLKRRDLVDLNITEARTPVALGDADLVLINDEDLTYAKVRLDARTLDSVEVALATLEPLQRALVWSSLWNATRDGELAVSRYLRIVTANAPAELNTGLLSGVLSRAAYAIGHYLPDADRVGQRLAWLDTTWAALEAAAPASDEQQVWARAFADAAAYDEAGADRSRALLAGNGPAGLPVDPELRWALLTALRATGHATGEDLSAELERDDTASGRTASIRALWAKPAKESRATAWRAAWDDHTLTNDHLSATISGIRTGGRRDLIEHLDGDYFARITNTWRDRSIELARRLVVGLFPASEDLTLVDAWIAEHTEAPSALRRLVIEQRDHLARDLRVRAGQERL